MTTNWMRGLVLALMVGTFGFAASSEAQAQSSRVGADYYVFTYPGSGPDDTEGRVDLSAENFDTLAWYDQSCREQMKKQQPSAIKEVGADVLISAASSAVGVGLGAKAAFGDAVSAGDYAQYGAGGGAGGGLFAGLTGRGRSTRYVVGQCMNQFAAYGVRKGDLDSGVFIALNPASVRGKPIKREGLPSRPRDDDAADTTADTSADTQPVIQ